MYCPAPRELTLITSLLAQVLSKRVVTRLRALIILPTRDLVMQVRETLESLSRGTGLKVSSRTLNNSYSAESESSDRYCYGTTLFRAGAGNACG
jgi:superfamily II DNA/RNA helicase